MHDYFVVNLFDVRMRKIPLQGGNFSARVEDFTILYSCLGRLVIYCYYGITHQVFDNFWTEAYGDVFNK